MLRTVLVATDFEPSSSDALESAHRLAKLAGAALHVVHVVAPPSPDEGAMGDVRAALRGADIPDADAQVHVIPGSPAEAIGALADRVTADVIVVGPQRRRRAATPSQPLGSTARRIAERAYAPVLIVGKPLRLPLHRVLVPTDFSETARGALLVGLSWASGLRARAGGPTTLTALHVQSADEDAGKGVASAPLDRELELLKRNAGNWADVIVQGSTEGATDAARAIMSCAVQHNADLVVIGTRGLGADDTSRLGSISESVAVNGLVPTLLVPPGVWRVHAGGR